MRRKEDTMDMQALLDFRLYNTFAKIGEERKRLL
jgi:hypothetical protein